MKDDQACFPSNNVTDGRAPIVRGTLQWVVALLVVMNLFFSISFLLAAAYGLKVIHALGMKPPLLCQASFAKTTCTSSPSTGPDNVELQGLAWEAVRLIAGADSTNAPVYFQQSKEFMTTQCRKAFEQEIEPSLKDIVDLKIVRILEAKEIRPVKSADETLGIDRYDLLVSGEMKTYRLGGNELLMHGPFSYRVQLVPTQRSIANPRGLLVSRISTALQRKGESNAANPIN